MLPDAVRLGKLLLALHVRLGAGQHDPRLHRDEGAAGAGGRALPPALRVHGPDDHEQKPGDLRAHKVRKHGKKERDAELDLNF